MRPLRREMQIIFQDPYSSLNPRKSVGQIIGEPFTIHKTEKDVKSRVRELLAPRRPEPGALQPLPARVLGRPAAADRHRPRARAAAEADRLRRAGVGARRLGAGADPQPAEEPPGRVRPHLRLHLARPLGDPPGLRPDRGHVRRPRRRDRRSRSCSTSIRAIRTPRRCSRRCRGPRRTAPAAKRQRIVLGGDVPVARLAAAGVRLPSALPALRAGPLRRRDAGCCGRSRATTRPPATTRSSAGR